MKKLLTIAKQIDARSATGTTIQFVRLPMLQVEAAGKLLDDTHQFLYQALRA